MQIKVRRFVMFVARVALASLFVSLANQELLHFSKQVPPLKDLRSTTFYFYSLFALVQLRMNVIGLLNSDLMMELYE